jgi:hypothetical protein
LAVVVELDVGELFAADDPLLLGNRYAVPGRQVMQVFLHDHIAAAGEVRVLVADDRRCDGRTIDGIFRAVDEADEIAIVEIAEAVHLVLCDDEARPRGS